MNQAQQQTAGLEFTLVIRPSTPEQGFQAMLYGQDRATEFSSPHDLIHHLEALLLGTAHLK